MGTRGLKANGTYPQKVKLAGLLVVTAVLVATDSGFLCSGANCETPSDKSAPPVLTILLSVSVFLCPDPVKLWAHQQS